MTETSILLVDDEEIIRKSLARELHHEHFAVTVATGGREAIHALEERDYDVVITDLMMPEVDGLHVLAAAKKIAPLTSVIILTGYGDTQSAIEALRLGADDFLRKPCEFEELVYRIQSCLEKRNLLLELKQTEKALRESEQRRCLALESAQAGIWEWDLETNTSIWSDQLWLLHGLEPNRGGLSFAQWRKTIHPDDRSKTEQVIQECILRGEEIHVEWRVRCKDGLERWLMSRGLPLQDGHDRVVRYLGVIMDISKQKLTEKTLKESEAKYRLIFDTAMDAIFITDMQAQILEVNAWACDQLGYTRAELLAMTIDQLNTPGEAQCTPERLARLQNQGHITFETVHQCKNGRCINTEVNAQQISWNGQRAIMSIWRDITERKRAEEQLKVSLAEKEVLLREVHHRVKNNMASIIGLFDLQRRSMNDPQAQTALVVLSARIRAMSLVHEKLYRTESLSQIDFQEYVQSLLAHLRASFGSPHIECAIVAQGVQIPLDLAVPCGMIINELIINALKYAFPGERPGAAGNDDRIIVEVRQDHNRFTLSVGDNGVGLPSGLELNTTDTMGLSLVRMLGQHQLGGQYQVDQRGGTRFTLTFALHEGGATYA